MVKIKIFQNRTKPALKVDKEGKKRQEKHYMTIHRTKKYTIFSKQKGYL